MCVRPSLVTVQRSPIMYERGQEPQIEQKIRISPYFADLNWYKGKEHFFNPTRPVYDVLSTCGKCEECISAKRYKLSIRFKNEMDKHSYKYFLTITFNDQNILRNPLYPNPFNNSSFNTMLSKYHVKKIIANLRNKLKRRYGKDFTFSYFLCGEYGPKTLRAHYHIALFMDKPLPIEKKKGIKEKYTCKIFESKQYGFYDLVKIKPNDKVSNYITKYMLKSSNLIGNKPLEKYSIDKERAYINLFKSLDIPILKILEPKFQAPFLLKSRRFGNNAFLERDIEQGILTNHYKRKFIIDLGRIKNIVLYNLLREKIYLSYKKYFRLHKINKSSNIVKFKPNKDPF